jgi:DNA-binding MarR family transcriptional regulator
MTPQPSPSDLLDPILHQTVRTQIVAYLMGRGEATFSDLKRVLEISDGNLESHLKKLTEVAYVASRKDTSNPRPQTIYSLTKTGRVALRRYTENLQRLLNLTPETSTRTSSTQRKFA